MFVRSAEGIKFIVKEASVIVVGLGHNGREFIKYADNAGLEVVCIYDNNPSIVGHSYMGYTIETPVAEKEDRNVFYIVTPERRFREELKTQLMDLGIPERRILTYHSHRNYDYMENLPESEYKKEISEMYREKFGYDMNWNNPNTYNEIVNWEKLNVHDPLRTCLADKYLVRDWVKKKIGKKYLTRQYGHWKNPEDIDFDSLPEKFVFKTNNGSGRNIIVEDITKINRRTVVDQLKEWTSNNFFYNNLEWQYKDIKPQVIAEEYLEGVATTVYDYNVYCFHGEPNYIWCIKGSHRPGCVASFYDLDWNMQEFYFGYPKDIDIAPKPEGLDEMIEMSRLLSSEFKHVRVDWYNLPDGRILFGEMTFSSWGGFVKFMPEKYDEIFGKLIQDRNS